MEERKGFFTEEQEQKLDAFIKLEGIAEAMDGTAIKLVDNIILEKLKDTLNKKDPELLEVIYAVIDDIFDNI